MNTENEVIEKQDDELVVVDTTPTKPSCPKGQVWNSISGKCEDDLG